MTDAYCIGETMALVAPAPPARLHHGGPVQLDVAGAESNVAIGLAQLGVSVAWRGRVGADPLGRLVLDRIAAAGVDIDGAETDPTHPTGAFFKDPAPEGTTVHYLRRGSAGARLHRGMLPPTARLVHLTGVTPALSPQARDLVRHTLVDRPVRGALVSFDVNHRPALWSGPDEAATVLAELADRADIVFVGLDEANRLWGCTDPAEVRAVLPGAGAVVVKDGAVGATEGDTFVPSVPVPVLEPVGAGDAFAAGYLAALLGGADVPARLRLGHRVAAAVLATVGDTVRLAADLQEIRP
ncbi:sugar kinase [Micromonospora coxensis]|uniref:2-dehydro-3-deoxygluconokinase n=1 Tax=Micromonospora coxensis TaxID=356852 RepID=A0A1C5K1V2_9ACTN|nr:sugar kinase [Micromonospora coxensis]SCG76728.1 2-dehydro-3-deoxygluconokinase [Micromonospora coxensis]